MTIFNKKVVIPLCGMHRGASPTFCEIPALVGDAPHDRNCESNFLADKKVVTPLCGMHRGASPTFCEIPVLVGDAPLRVPSYDGNCESSFLADKKTATPFSEGSVAGVSPAERRGFMRTHRSAVCERVQSPIKKGKGGNYGLW